jgi:hypothetical protein
MYFAFTHPGYVSPISYKGVIFSNVQVSLLAVSILVQLLRNTRLAKASLTKLPLSITTNFVEYKGSQNSTT